MAANVVEKYDRQDDRLGRGTSMQKDGERKESFLVNRKFYSYRKQSL